jgi:hypothetical protein
MDLQELDYQSIASQETGSHQSEPVVILVPFDRYEVMVELGPNGEFVGIRGISVSRDFLSANQRISAMKALGYHDVDDFYQLDKEE